MARGFVAPAARRAGQLATVMLLIIGIVGTTVAPWQLFFQQSYVIDKRITPRFMQVREGRPVDRHRASWSSAPPRSWASPPRRSPGTPGVGHFTDAAGLAAGPAGPRGRIAGVLFAIALLDASIIGAFAVSLSTAYAIGDVFGLNHSLHRGVKGAKGFYAVYGGLIASPRPRWC